MTHLMVNLAVKVEFCGLPYAYLIDVPHGKIHMKSLNTFVRNMVRPKGSMGKGYIMEEVIGFCTKYMQIFQTMEQ